MAGRNVRRALAGFANSDPDYLGFSGRSFPRAISGLLCQDFRHEFSRNEISTSQILVQPTGKAKQAGREDIR